VRAAPVSGDLLVKLAMLGLLAGGTWWALQRVRAGLPALGDLSVPDAINPFSENNVAYQTANAGVSALAGREETVGGWVRGATSDDDARIRAMLENGTLHDGRSFQQWDVTPIGGGRANNPSAYVGTTSPFSIWR
jgi:hypothetical protein